MSTKQNTPRFSLTATGALCASYADGTVDAFNDIVWPDLSKGQAHVAGVIKTYLDNFDEEIKTMIAARKRTARALELAVSGKTWLTDEELALAEREHLKYFAQFSDEVEAVRTAAKDGYVCTMTVAQLREMFTTTGDATTPFTFQDVISIARESVEAHDIATAAVATYLEDLPTEGLRALSSPFLTMAQEAATELALVGLPEDK